MSISVKEFYSEWKVNLQNLGRQAPDMAKSFGGMHATLMKDGNLGESEKELMAMAIGLATGCNECVFLHMQSAVRAGATRGQIVEAAGVAVLMAGGPAFAHMPLVLETMDLLLPE